MTATEAVEIAKKVNNSVSNDVLYRACERLERMIEKYAKKEHRIFEKDARLLACGGGIAEGYDDLYTVYLKREAALSVEDWDCFGSYDAVFANRWTELCREIVRGAAPEKSSFTPDWKWVK